MKYLLTAAMILAGSAAQAAMVPIQIPCFASFEEMEARGGVISPVHSEVQSDTGFELHIGRTPRGRVAYVHNPARPLPYCVIWSSDDTSA